MLFLKVVGGGTAGLGAVLVGNHYFVKESWKKNHPLVQESLKLLPKDEQVRKHIGGYLTKSKKITGVLEPYKNWANISFDLEGPEGSAKVSILADAEPASEESDYIVEAPEDELSTIQRTLAMISGDSRTPQNLKWKILSMHVKFDDITSHPIIAEGVRTHSELRELKNIEASSEEDMNLVPDSQEKLSTKRKREKVFKRAQKRWMSMAGVCASGLLVWVLAKRFLKTRPVGNSLFFFKALDILKADPFVRNEIGVPLNFLQNVKGQLNYNMTKGNAETIVYGPKGFGKMYASGQYSTTEKLWNFQEIQVEKDGKLYSVLSNK